MKSLMRLGAVTPATSGIARAVTAVMLAAAPSSSSIANNGMWVNRFNVGPGPRGPARGNHGVSRGLAMSAAVARCATPPGVSQAGRDLSARRIHRCWLTAAMPVSFPAMADERKGDGGRHPGRPERGRPERGRPDGSAPRRSGPAGSGRPQSGRPQAGRPQQSWRPSDSESGPRESSGPAIPATAEAEQLAPEIRAELFTLDKSTADTVARHLVAAGELLDSDLEAALAHARAV